LEGTEPQLYGMKSLSTMDHSLTRETDLKSLQLKAQKNLKIDSDDEED
jgi:hypothetical protein